MRVRLSSNGWMSAVELGGEIPERVPEAVPGVDKLLVFLWSQFIDLLLVPEPGVVVNGYRSVVALHEDLPGLDLRQDVPGPWMGGVLDRGGLDDDVREGEVSANIAVAGLHELGFHRGSVRVINRSVNLLKISSCLIRTETILKQPNTSK